MKNELIFKNVFEYFYAMCFTDILKRQGWKETDGGA